MMRKNIKKTVIIVLVIASLYYLIFHGNTLTWLIVGGLAIAGSLFFLLKVTFRKQTRTLKGLQRKVFGIPEPYAGYSERQLGPWPGIIGLVFVVSVYGYAAYWSNEYLYTNLEGEYVYVTMEPIEVDGFSVFTTDQYFVSFSFQYPADYRVSINEPKGLNMSLRVFLERPKSGEGSDEQSITGVDYDSVKEGLQDNGIDYLSHITIEVPLSFQSAKDKMEAELRDIKKYSKYGNMTNLVLEEKHRFTLDENRGWKLSYSYLSQPIEIPFLSTQFLGESYPVKVTRLFLEKSGHVWQITVSSDPSLHEAALKDTEHILKTLSPTSART